MRFYEWWEKVKSVGEKNNWTARDYAREAWCYFSDKSSHMEVYSIKGMCECGTKIEFIVDDEDTSTWTKKCKECPRLWALEKLPEFELIEMKDKLPEGDDE